MCVRYITVIMGMWGTPPVCRFLRRLVRFVATSWSSASPAGGPVVTRVDTRGQSGDNQSGVAVSFIAIIINDSIAGTTGRITSS